MGGGGDPLRIPGGKGSSLSLGSDVLIGPLSRDPVKGSSPGAGFPPEVWTQRDLDSTSSSSSQSPPSPGAGDSFLPLQMLIRTAAPFSPGRAEDQTAQLRAKAPAPIKMLKKKKKKRKGSRPSTH